ncbi:hypothetical protein DL770_006523 [Monosporascus sp. CRB-9-2]|nr:hypothetical protein DL770_006523 [Monosporascus sp. CRB-9-2]
MSTEDDTYAPRSPDLSFLAAGSDIPSNVNSSERPQIPPPANLYYHKATEGESPGAIKQGKPQLHHTSQLGYQPQSPPLPLVQARAKPTSAGAGFGFNSNQHHQQHHHQFAQYSSNPYPPHQPAVQQPGPGSYPQQQSAAPPIYGTLSQEQSVPRPYYPPFSAPTSVTAHYQTSQPQLANSLYPPAGVDPYSHAQPSVLGLSVSQTPVGQGLHSPTTLETLQYDGHRQARTSHSASAMPPRKAAQVAAKQPDVMPSPVKTKFPTARIKRIMQADEEVGKVAQQTPIAVGKALELFMVQLVTKSAEVAREKNSKRITAQMLKQAVESANEWDFLQDIVAKVSEKEESSKSAAGRARPESDSDEEADAGEPKKKGRGGRKKKAPA